MDKIFWNGDVDSYIKRFNNNEFELLMDSIQDNEDYITSLSIGDSDFEELEKTLQYGFMLLDDFKEAIIDKNLPMQMAFEFGCLYGLMQLSSQICYEKKKEYRISESMLSYSRISHFDDILSFLEKGEELSHTELGTLLKLKPNALTECMKKVLRTNMVKKRRSGKFILYSLTDNGLRYAKIRRQESNQYQRRLALLINSLSERVAELETIKRIELPTKYYNLSSNYIQLSGRKLENKSLKPALFYKAPKDENSEEKSLLGTFNKRRKSVLCENRY